jgi:hypothetical protein
MTGEHVDSFATAKDFWASRPNVGIVLAYRQQERRHAYDQIRLYDAKHPLCNPYTPLSVHTITLRSPNTPEIMPATWPRASTMATSSHFRNDEPTRSITLFACRSRIQHPHHHYRSSPRIYHQTLAPLSLPISGFHFLWIFERSSSAQPRNFVSGWKHPSPFGCNVFRSRKYDSKLSRWKRSFTIALPTAVVLFRSHQTPQQGTHSTLRETCQMMCAELEFYT